MKIVKGVIDAVLIGKKRRQVKNQRFLAVDVELREIADISHHQANAFIPGQEPVMAR